MRAPLFVVALATASAFAQPARDFVSTRATAAKLGGLPGRPCAPADARGIKGPCWDPPGYERAVPMPTLSSGKRLVAAPNWKERAPHAIY